MVAYGKTGFDSDKYIKMQKEEILQRKKMFGKRLYLEVGGKLFDDFHAARVLPGFDPNIQIKLLQSFKDDLEVVFCISATQIEKSKVREDTGMTYDMEVLRLIEALQDEKIYINSVVITLFSNQTSAIKFGDKLKALGMKVYFHSPTKGYPTNVDEIVSDDGYGKNPYIEVSRDIVVVTAPGPGSGKLGTCLSQLYHEHKKGKKSGYAKFEKFPVWNLPLKHPVNVAYEAATADLKDVNMVDSYHFAEYGKMTVNYNRDIECFPVVRDILTKIMERSPYKSPTDMGINTIVDAITNEDVVVEAAKQEIIRRYYKAKCECKKGNVAEFVPERIKLLMNELKISTSERPCVLPALAKSDKTGLPSIAIELADGTIITGRKTDILSASASCFLNAIKHLAGIDDKIKLIAPSYLEPIKEMKHAVLKRPESLLSIRDVLFVLAISSRDNEFVKIALSKVEALTGCEVHSTQFLERSNEDVFRRLSMNVTCEPVAIKQV